MRMKKDQADFEVVYEQIRAGHYQQALDLIYDAKKNQIYSCYQQDENHAWYVIGDIFYKMTHHEQAIFAFKNAIQAWHEDVDAYLAWSNILNEQGAYQQAINVLTQALNFSNDARLFYQFANNLFDQQKFAEALIYYKKVPVDCTELYSLAVKNSQYAQRKLRLKKS